MTYILRMEFEFSAEDFEEAKALLSRVDVSAPERFIQTTQTLAASEESLIDYHEKHGS